MLRYLPFAILLSGVVRLSRTRSATRESRMDKAEFEAAQKAEKNGVNIPIYGVPIGAYHDVDEAKQAGRRESQERRFNYDSDQSYWLIRNEVSKTGADALLKCFNTQGSGLRIWLESQAGQLYRVNLLLRNATEFNWKKPSLDNFVMTSAPPDANVNPGQVYPFTFRRQADNKDGMIELRVGSLRDQLIFPPVPRLVKLREETQVYASKGMAVAKSCGQDGHRPGSMCEAAPSGWRFVKGTEHYVPKPGTASGAAGGVTGIDVLPERTCITVWAYTGDERICQTTEGGFSVVMQRLVPDELPASDSSNVPNTSTTNRKRGR
jgi:hypothetical protein